MQWIWSQDCRLGWWLGSAEGFDGTARVFPRDGRWCLRIESGFNGSAIMAHFTEGYLSDAKAKRSAEHWAVVANNVRLAQACGLRIAK